MSERIYCVYMHTNKDNGKIYIGRTKNRIVRFSKGQYKRCLNFYKALKEYNSLQEGFTTTILEDNLTKEEADNAEIKYIKQYNSTDENIGYNICKGGSGVSKPHTEEWKRKQSLRVSGSLNPNYGKHWDDEHKRMLSESQKGKTFKREQWLKDKIRNTHLNMSHYNEKHVKCITTNEIFKSQRECARVLKERTGMKFKGAEIGCVCKGKFKQTHGYTFEYV